MEERKFKIVTDSSADLFELSGVNFAAAPLKIITKDREFTDDEKLDVHQMVEYLKGYKGRSKTSCPNKEDYLKAFGDADEVYCVTITAKLSGSYNSACLAKREYEQAHPDRRVYVFNSLSTGAEMALVIEKIREMLLSGADFDTTVKAAEEYSKSTGLIFMLESMTNLANNGRVSGFVAKMAGFLGIRLVGRASDVGDLEPIEKCRGAAGALTGVLNALKNLGYSGGKIYVTHCENPDFANSLLDRVKAIYPDAEAKLYAMGGLTSFYAERGGLIVGFEKTVPKDNL